MIFIAYQPKKVATPITLSEGPITINIAETQAATEQRKRVLRSRELKWSSQDGHCRGCFGAFLPFSFEVGIVFLFPLGKEATLMRRKLITTMN